MSHRRTARRRVLRAAQPARPQLHDVAGCSCAEPTYSTGAMPFPMDGAGPSEEDLVALLRCRDCGRRPPPGWDPWGDAASGAGGGPGAGPALFPVVVPIA